MGKPYHLKEFNMMPVRSHLTPSALFALVSFIFILASCFGFVVLIANAKFSALFASSVLSSTFAYFLILMAQILLNKFSPPPPEAKLRSS